MTAEDELQDDVLLNASVLERQRRHLVCHSMLDWQPVERPEKWSGVGSTSLLVDDPG